MNRQIRIERILRSLTVVFVFVGAGALLWRPGIPSNEIAPTGIEARSVKNAPAAPLDVTANQIIVQGNIFSASRKAPAVRYNPFEPDWGSADPATPEPAADTASATAAGDGVPKLFGTMIGARGSAALLRLDPALLEAQLYREGDRAGRYRVEKINEQSVVLRGPAGRVVLRLVIPEGSDDGDERREGSTL
jgi:hypothetical protein